MNKLAKDLEASPIAYNAIGTPIVNAQETPREKKSASVLFLMIISLPRLAVTMAWFAQFAAISPYLSTMVSKSAVQVIQFIGPVCGIILTPVVGALSDKCTSKYGRRRPFIFWSALGSIICFILMGYTAEIGEWLGDYGSGTTMHRPMTALIMAIFYLWMDITVNFVQTPIFLLISDFAGDRQTLASSIGQGWATLGAIVVAGYVEFWGAAYLSLHWFLGMQAIVMAITCIPCLILAKETPLIKDENDTESNFSRMKSAFTQIYQGLRALPPVLTVYSIIFVCVSYGYSAYNGNKGQFFGFEVYDGVATGATSCGGNCTQAQTNYNKGVSMATGRADLLCNIVGYLYTWLMPVLVKVFGARLVVTVTLIPQVLLIALAYTNTPTLAVFFVVIVSITQATFYAMLVPIIIHVVGGNNSIGLYVGAINSANNFGHLVNYAVGSGIVNTSMGYTLPVLVGGIVSAVGFFISLFFFRVDMKAM